MWLICKPSIDIAAAAPPELSARVLKGTDWSFRQASGVDIVMEASIEMSQAGRHITSLVLAACIFSDVSDQAYAQDLCDLGAQVVELLSTIDACAATGDQLAELEGVRQQIIAPYADIDCGELQERIAELELTLPRRSVEWPTTLDQPAPMCEA